MDLTPGSKRKAVGELLSRLLSRDPVEFNAAINSSFSSGAVYSGHGVEIKGASNVKHAAWLFHLITAGRAASFDLKDIEWNEEDKSAIVHTVRYLRLRFLPLVGFAVPVKTQLRFHADGDANRGSSSQLALYVTSFEDHWPVDTFIKSLPLLGWLYQMLFTPIATYLVLILSNAAFAGHARVTSTKRHYLHNSVDVISDRATRALPNQLTSNVNSGFQEGTKLAQGWGTSSVNLIQRATYPLLSTLEAGSQRATTLVNGVSPLSLPYPFIYDAHCHPSGKSVKGFGEGDKKLAAPVEESPSSGRSTGVNVTNDSHAPSQDTPAVVRVTPSMDGGDQGKTVDIASRVNNETRDEPAPAEVNASKEGSSLYDQLKHGGELPKEDEGVKPAGRSEEQGANGSQSKKKKEGSKKKRGHAHPPSFKEGLQQAEDNEA